jgi:predicted TIM-barrel fold metal-dependent hydrolase
MTPGYRFVDAEHHYYEPDDCFTRHLEPAYRDRAVHVVRASDGSGTWLFGERPLSKAGEARNKALPPGTYGLAYLTGQRAYPPELDTNLPEFTERSARLRVMDAQDVEATIMLPSHAIHVEHDIRHDVAATYANFRSFNRWVEEEWGYAHEERIFGVPYLPLLDVGETVRELERLLALGARVVMIRTGPVAGMSTANRHFDPVWARLNEAGIPFLMHFSNAGYTEFFSAAWGEEANPQESDVTPFQWFSCFGARPFTDTLALLILHNLFGHFPNLRLISVSNGVDWVRDLRKLDSLADPSFPFSRDEAKCWPGGRLPIPPSETLRRHVYAAPFVYEDVPQLVRLIGADHVLMATDYPHPEGFPTAADFLRIMQGLTGAEVRAIMRDNAASLLGIRQ